MCAVCSKRNETYLKKKVILKMFTYKVTPFKVVSFGSNTLLEAVLPSLEALLEIFFCEVFQSVGYGSLDTVDRFELMTS